MWELSTGQLMTLITYTPIVTLINFTFAGKKGGRGLKEIKTMHEIRLIAIRQHLSINGSRNNIEYVIECEKSSTIRVGNELLTNKNITNNLDEKPVT